MTSIELFQEGRLSDALAQQRPLAEQSRDPAERLLLAHLLLFEGRFDEVRTTLDPLRAAHAELGPYLDSYLQLITAEQKRQRRDMPTFLMPPPGHVAYRLEAREAAIRGKFDESTARLDEAEAQREPVVGHINGREFDDARDSDEILGPNLEMLVDDRYVWFPFEQVRRLNVGPVETLRDRYFVPAVLTAVSGDEWAVFLPALYAGSSQSDDEDIRLGQATDWFAEPDGPTCGIGLRVLLFGEEEMSLFDFSLWEG